MGNGLRTAAIPVVDPTDDLAFAVERNGTEEAEFFTEQWRCVDEFDERAIAVTNGAQRERTTRQGFAVENGGLVQTCSSAARDGQAKPKPASM